MVTDVLEEPVDGSRMFLQNAGNHQHYYTMSEDRNLNFHRRENLKSQNLQISINFVNGISNEIEEDFTWNWNLSYRISYKVHTV